MCCYRDIKNFERFNLVVQSLICLCVCQLKGIDVHLDAAAVVAAAEKASASNNNNNAGTVTSNTGGDSATTPPETAEVEPSKSENASTSDSVATSSASATTTTDGKSANKEWLLPELEKLFILVSKAFLLNFPLYIAYKHGVHSRLDDISTHEAQVIGLFRFEDRINILTQKEVFVNMFAYRRPFKDLSRIY